ncbi:hypothetical protein D3C86_1459270 [compost metagenome]
MIFETWDEGVGTKLKGILLRFAAFECYFINETFEIDDDNIAASCLSFFKNNQFSMTLLQTSKLFIQFFFRNSCVNRIYFDTFVIAKCYFRLNGYFRFELHGLTFTKLLYVYFRTINRLDFNLFDRLYINFWQNDIDSVLIQTFNTEFSFKDGTRHFPFTESWNVYFR